MVLPLIMSDTGYMYQNWLSWKTCFLNYMIRHNLITKPEVFKINLLRDKIGSSALNCKEVYDIMFNSRIQHVLTNFLQVLDEYFGTRKNELVERFNFFTRSLHKDERIENFIFDLKVKARTCNFGILTDSLIRDKVIASIYDQELRTKLFHVLNLELTTLEDICIEHNNQKEANTKKKIQHFKDNNSIKKHKNSGNNRKFVKGKEEDSYNNNILAIDGSNVNHTKISEKTQNLNKEVNSDANDKTTKDSKNDNDKISSRGNSNINSNKTDVRNSNSDIAKNISSQRNSNNNKMTMNDLKNDNSDHGKLCKENRDGNDKTKMGLKNGNIDISKKGLEMNIASQGICNEDNKTMNDLKNDNSDHGKLCKENRDGNDKTKMGLKNGNIGISKKGLEMNIASQGICNEDNKTMNDLKNDNSDHGKLCKENRDGNDKTKMGLKNGNIDISKKGLEMNIASQGICNEDNKTMNDLKNDNSDHGKLCKENRDGNDKTKMGLKNGNIGISKKGLEMNIASQGICNEDNKTMNDLKNDNSDHGKLCKENRDGNDKTKMGLKNGNIDISKKGLEMNIASQGICNEDNKTMNDLKNDNSDHGKLCKENRDGNDKTKMGLKNGNIGISKKGLEMNIASQGICNEDNKTMNDLKNDNSDHGKLCKENRDGNDKTKMGLKNGNIDISKKGLEMNIASQGICNEDNKSMNDLKNDNSDHGKLCKENRDGNDKTKMGLKNGNIGISKKGLEMNIASQGICNEDNKTMNDLKNDNSDHGKLCKENRDGNDKTKMGLKNGNIGISKKGLEMNIASQGICNEDNKTMNDLKNDNSDHGKLCKENRDGNDKTKMGLKNGNIGISKKGLEMNIASQGICNEDNKTMNDLKNDNSDHGKLCKENRDGNDKTKMGLKNGNIGISKKGLEMNIASQGICNEDNKTMNDLKNDNSDHGKLCKENRDGNDKTKMGLKNGNIGISKKGLEMNIASQGTCNENNKTKKGFKNSNSDQGKYTVSQGSNENNETKTDLKYANSDNSKNAASQRNSSDNNKIRTDSKDDRYAKNPGMFLAYQDFNDKAKTDSKGSENSNDKTTKTDTNINDEPQRNFKSNSNTNTACQYNETGTAYKRRCWKCNVKHAEKSCPAWGHKCGICGQRNHYDYCCNIKTIKREGLRTDANIPRNALYTQTIQQENELKIPSAPELYGNEDAIYPNLHNVANVVENVTNIPRNALYTQTIQQENELKIPSAPELYGNEDAIYPNLHNVANVVENVANIPRNALHTQTIQQENELKLTFAGNNNIAAVECIEMWYQTVPIMIPSAPELYGNEDAIYPNLHNVANVVKHVPLNSEASPKCTASSSKQRRTRSNSEMQSCSLL